MNNETTADGWGCTEEACSALLAGGFKLHRPHHKVGIRSQNLSNVRYLNKYYRTQTSWWVSPYGEIMNWEQAIKSMTDETSPSVDATEKAKP